MRRTKPQDSVHLLKTNEGRRSDSNRCRSGFQSRALKPRGQTGSHGDSAVHWRYLHSTLSESVQVREIIPAERRLNITQEPRNGRTYPALLAIIKDAVHVSGLKYMYKEDSRWLNASFCCGFPRHFVSLLSVQQQPVAFFSGSLLFIL